MTEPAREFHGTGRRFHQKLGIYLTGVAIGLMLLGYFQWRKHLSAQIAPASATAQP